MPEGAPLMMGDSYFGMPSTPSFVQAYDPATMNLADYLSGKYDNAGIKSYREQALRKGPSQWAALAQQQNAQNTAASQDKAASTARGQEAQMEDELAMQGGLSSGARERAAQAGANNYMNMEQDLARQGNQNAMQIGMNDEQNRIQQLSALPGMDQSQAQMYEQAKQQDIANKMNATDRVNAYNQNLYNKSMEAWGAGKQADATAASGKK